MPVHSCLGTWEAMLVLIGLLKLEISSYNVIDHEFSGCCVDSDVKHNLFIWWSSSSLNEKIRKLLKAVWLPRIPNPPSWHNVSTSVAYTTVLWCHNTTMSQYHNVIISEPVWASPQLADSVQRFLEPSLSSLKYIVSKAQTLCSATIYIAQTFEMEQWSTLRHIVVSYGWTGQFVSQQMTT